MLRFIPARMLPGSLEGVGISRLLWQPVVVVTFVM